MQSFVIIDRVRKGERVGKEGERWGNRCKKVPDGSRLILGIRGIGNRG